MVYLSDKSHDKPGPTASRRMLDQAGVQYHRLIPSRSRIDITMAPPEMRVITPYK